jgi:hypothetical protein
MSTATATRKPKTMKEPSPVAILAEQEQADRDLYRKLIFAGENTPALVDVASRLRLTSAEVEDDLAAARQNAVYERETVAVHDLIERARAKLAELTGPRQAAWEAYRKLDAPWQEQQAILKAAGHGTGHEFEWGRLKLDHPRLWPEAQPVKTKHESVPNIGMPPRAVPRIPGDAALDLRV